MFTGLKVANIKLKNFYLSFEISSYYTLIKIYCISIFIKFKLAEISGSKWRPANEAR